MAVCAFLLPTIASAASGSTNDAALSLKLSGALDTSLAVPRKNTDAPVANAPAASVQPMSTPSAAPGEYVPKGRPSRDYIIGAEDLIEIQVFGVEQLTRTVRVNSRGQVSLPLVGTLQLGGLTGPAAEEVIRTKLAESFMQDPQVSLFIKEYTSQRVIIEGAVNKPGVYPLRGPTTLLQSLAVAGGQGSLSDMSEVMLFRSDDQGKRETLVFDVERIRSGEIEDPTVINEDLIVVKRSKARVIFKDSIVRDLADMVNPFRW